MKPTGESLGRFFKHQNWQFGKCLEPSLTCENKPIRAHSIQNARVVELLCTDNHVAMIKAHFSKDGPAIIFKDVGRNEASTFLGFCGEHDASIFRPLDTRPFSVDDAEQLFLLAYRSVSRELHATMESACKIQGAYQDRVARGLDDPKVPTAAGMQAVAKMVIAYETHQYRAENFDQELIDGDYARIQHDIIELTDQPPAVATSCLFSIDEVQVGDDVARAVLNVIPLSSERTVAILSYATKDAALARLSLGRVLQSSGFQQKYELSKLILERMENFALSPTLVKTWDEGKIETIKTAFLATIFSNGIVDDARLMLF